MALALVLFAIGLTAYAADTLTTPQGPVDRRVVLAPGETADIDAGGIRIGFQGVLGDSRCPADAVCIQGGDAIVRIDVLESGGALSTFDLHTGDMKPVRHGDLTIALEDLSPYPFSGRTIAPGEYRATLRVTRSREVALSHQGVPRPSPRGVVSSTWPAANPGQNPSGADVGHR